MCGIFGKLSFGGSQPLSLDVLKQMGDRIKYRGPDDDGYLIDSPLAMGMRRLSIIDLSGGKQPVFNETEDIAVVFNGEIYNFRELRKSLESRGHRFRTRTDTEVIVHLYEEKGVDLVHELRGMFAFALWDRRQKKLVLARDRVGKKPLYYAVTPGGITFGSEIKAILADIEISKKIDPAAVDQFFAMQFIPHPRTIFSSIQKLPPAHVLIISPTGVESLKSYWAPAYRPKIRISREDAVKSVIENLRESTRVRLESDVPLGVLLSGGIDSSAVVAMIASIQTNPIKTFSIGFENISGSDDLAHAELIARKFGTDHHPILLKADVSEHLPKLAAHFDEPFGDSSALSTYLVSREARKFVTVVLNGDGGDEAFAGYPRYANSYCAARMFHQLPSSIQSSIRKNLIRGIQNMGRSGCPWGLLNRRLAKMLVPAHRSIFQPEAFSASDRNRLYRPEFKAALNPLNWGPMLELMEKSIRETTTPAESLMFMDFNLYLPADLLVKMDMSTMANSLEARSPFLDHQFLEFAVSLPLEYKVAGKNQKWILKEALKPILPAQILSREKKGFGLPLRKWIREDLRPMIQDVVLDHPAGLERVFDMTKLKTEAESILNQRKGGEKRLWSLLVFELWHRGVMKSSI